MEQAMVEVLAQLRIAEHLGVVFAQVFAHRHREATGAAGRIHHHIAWGGVGSVIATISSMMWRGVRNWPLVPAVASLPSMYS